jgi:hypothetical protein
MNLYTNGGFDMSEENFNGNLTEEPIVTPESGQEAPQGGKGMAIASMVLGIVGMVLCCIWYISIPCAIVGLVLGIMHNKKNTKSGMATAGIVCSIIAIILAVAIIVLAAIGVAALSASGLNMNDLKNMK